MILLWAADMKQWRNGRAPFPLQHEIYHPSSPGWGDRGHQQGQDLAFAKQKLTQTHKKRPRPSAARRLSIFLHSNLSLGLLPSVCGERNRSRGARVVFEERLLWEEKI